jgi:hypothetical protein
MTGPPPFIPTNVARAVTACRDALSANRGVLRQTSKDACRLA